MKQSVMQLIITLAPYLLLQNVGARRINDISNPSRQYREAFTASNDLMHSFGLIDMLTFNEMLVREGDCEGI